MTYVDYTLTARDMSDLAEVAEAIMRANPDRRIDIEPAPTPIWTTPPGAAQIDLDTGDEVSPATPGVVAEYALGVRVNDGGPEPVWPQGVAARPRRESDPGFSAPMKVFLYDQ